jgi:CCR4-NOT transcription complex subunit 1
MVTIALLERGFISVQELDMQMARLIDSGSNTAITFTCNLIQACLLSNPPLCSYNAFLLSNEALARLPAEGIVQTTVTAVNQGISNKMINLYSTEASIESGDLTKAKECVISVYKEWIQIYGHPASNERNQLNYVALLQENKILSSKHLSLLFFRVSLEATVEAYSQNASVGSNSASLYQTVDALARLLVLIITYQPDSPGSVPHSGKESIIKDVFSVISMVLIHNHEQSRTSFNQKPFLRLFSSIFYGLHAAESHLEPVQNELLACISNHMHFLNPTIVPGFTFSWVQLISHRYFMPKLLVGDSKKVFFSIINFIVLGIL